MIVKLPPADPPKISVIGDGEPSDELLTVLARLLLVAWRVTRSQSGSKEVR